jgi:hypothetical protein
MDNIEKKKRRKTGILLCAGVVGKIKLRCI